MQILSLHPVTYFLLLIAFIACYLGDFFLRKESRVTRVLFPALECFVGCCAILVTLCFGGDLLLILCILLLMLLPLLL